METVKAYRSLTLRENYVLFLVETRGAVAVPSKSSKYHVYKTVDSRGDLFWFLGKSGSVRICRKNTSTKSIDWMPQIQKHYVTWVQKKFEETEK
jgi:hypothetical protein